MALEGQAVCSFIWGALVADNGPGGVNSSLGGDASTPGRIFRDRVSRAAALPSATIALVSHVDENTLGGVRAFAMTLVDVRFIGPGVDYSELNPLASRADVVLQESLGTSGGVSIVKLRRTDLRAFVEDDAGEEFSHVIATYRTEAHAAP